MCWPESGAATISQGTIAAPDGRHRDDGRNPAKAKTLRLLRHSSRYKEGRRVSGSGQSGGGCEIERRGWKLVKRGLGETVRCRLSCGHRPDRVIHKP
jgi:hypothetical protein